jgi:hypothetical protein
MSRRPPRPRAVTEEKTNEKIERLDADLHICIRYLVSINFLPANYGLDQKTNGFGVAIVEFKLITTTDGWNFLSRQKNGSELTKSHAGPPFPQEDTKCFI